MFLVIFSIFLTIPVVMEKIKVKLAFAIPAGAPMILVNAIIDTPILAALKTIKILIKTVTYLIFYCMIFFD